MDGEGGQTSNRILMISNRFATWPNNSGHLDDGGLFVFLDMTFSSTCGAAKDVALVWLRWVLDDPHAHTFAGFAFYLV
jgi:hypothetical protein